MRHLSPRVRRRNRGFTLIELLVVIVVLALLLSIAIPTYLSQQRKARDAKAEVDLNYAYRALRSITVDYSDVFPSTANTLLSVITSSEPELTAVSASSCTASAGPTSIVVQSSSSPQRISLCVRSDTGTYWHLTADPSGSPELVSGYRGAIAQSAPVAYYRFDEASGTTAKDTMGTKDATYNAVALGQPGALATDGDKATTFGPGITYVQTPVLLNPQTSSLSVEAWAKWNGSNLSSGNVVASQQDGSGGTGRSLLYIDTSTGDWCSFLGGFSTCGPVANTGWHYLVMTYSATTGTVSLYCDGTLAASGVHWAQLARGNWLIGANKTLSSSFNGEIDETAIYNRVLSASEIATHYDTGR